MNPTGIITAIGGVLGLLDKFTDIVGKIRSQPSRPHKVQAEQTKDALILRENGLVVETVRSADFRLQAWDEVRPKRLQQIGHCSMRFLRNSPIYLSMRRFASSYA